MYKSKSKSKEQKSNPSAYAYGWAASWAFVTLGGFSCNLSRQVINPPLYSSLLGMEWDGMRWLSLEDLLLITRLFVLLKTGSFP